MPVEKWTPERRLQRTREALLDAAATVFAERGFQGASLDEIAATAGYTRGAIYKHFADKEELLHEVCVRLNERTFAEFDELPSGSDLLDTSDLPAVTAQWASMVERDTEFRVVMLEFQLHAYRNPDLRERALTFVAREPARDRRLPVPTGDGQRQHPARRRRATRCGLRNQLRRIRAAGPHRSRCRGPVPASPRTPHARTPQPHRRHLTSLIGIGPIRPTPQADASMDVKRPWRVGCWRCVGSRGR